MNFRAFRVLVSGKAIYCACYSVGRIHGVCDGLKTIRRKNQLVICHQPCE